MAGVRLAPCDGGCPVALPPGETLLGRGPLLGVSAGGARPGRELSAVLSRTACNRRLAMWGGNGFGGAEAMAAMP